MRVETVSTSTTKIHLNEHICLPLLTFEHAWLIFNNILNDFGCLLFRRIKILCVNRKPNRFLEMQLHAHILVHFRLQFQKCERRFTQFKGVRLNMRAFTHTIGC